MATRAPIDDTPHAPARGGWVDALRRLPARIVALPILVYRYGISPVIGQRCRFYPTCSSYGLEALGRFGALRGGWLTAARVARCHPWHPGGVEPVPDAFEPPAAARYLGRLLRDTASRPGALAGPCPCDPPRPTRDGHAVPPHRS